MNDRDLLTTYQRTPSPQLFAQIVSTHINLVYSVARRHVKDPHLAEDISQEVFLSLARKAPALHPDTPLAGWLFTTARLTSLESLRAKSRRTRHESEAAMSQEPPEPPDPTWSLIAEDIDKAVADLPVTDRDALLLRYFTGKSNSEIAATLAISEEAAKKRVQRALDALQKLLTSRGLAPTSALTALTLAAALTTHAVQAAPPTLASSITSVASHAVGISAAKTLVTKGTLMAAKVKTTLVLAGDVVAITTSAATALYIVKHNSPTAPPTTPTVEVPVAADTASQPTAPADGWRGWTIGEYRAASPFQAVRWNNDTPEVQVNDTWYQLLKFNDLPADQLITAAKSADPDWKRRFAEDLPALLAYMGHEPAATATLELKNLQTQKTETLTDVPLTTENRRAIMKARHPAPTPPPQ